MSYPTNIEAALQTALLADMATVAAALTPTATARVWKDQANHAVYDAILVHVMPADPDPENTVLDGPLWTVLVNIAAATHTEQTPPASGSTPVAADPLGTRCRTAFAAARAKVLSGLPAVANATLLRARVGESEDIGEGPVNMLAFRIRATYQLEEV